jgi:hypothetical protein
MFDPSKKAQDLHAIRKKVSARDKVLVGEKPFAEAVKLMCEKYQLNQDSAAAFVKWQKTIASGGDASVQSIPSEKWHLKFDEETGAWVKVPQPGDPKPKPEPEQ